MTVRCKFMCESKTEHQHGAVTVVLLPVTSDKDPKSENSTFWKWTPSGRLEFQSLNAAAAAHIVPGKSYYLDITPAE